MYKISSLFVSKTIQTARDISVTCLQRDSLPSEREFSIEKRSWVLATLKSDNDWTRSALNIYPTTTF